MVVSAVHLPRSGEIFLSDLAMNTFYHDYQGQYINGDLTQNLPDWLASIGKIKTSSGKSCAKQPSSAETVGVVEFPSPTSANTTFTQFVPNDMSMR